MTYTDRKLTNTHCEMENRPTLRVGRLKSILKTDFEKNIKHGVLKKNQKENLQLKKNPNSKNKKNMFEFLIDFFMERMVINI